VDVSAHSFILRARHYDDTNDRGLWLVDLRVFFSYFLKAIKWARKYGLRINLDLHALPGSQNG
jgi:aryl-phospho-beta-D-glucosidase BglC (GH1 family)